MSPRYPPDYLFYGRHSPSRQRCLLMVRCISGISAVRQTRSGHITRYVTQWCGR